MTNARSISLLLSLPALVVALTIHEPATALAAPPKPKPAQHKKPPARPTTPKPEPAPEPAQAPSEPVLQRSNRMELDARVVRGETARSGAVYLFQRAPRRLPPLVGLSQSYLDEIVVPVLGADALAPPLAEAPVEPAPAPTPPPPASPPTKPTPKGGR